MLVQAKRYHDISTGHRVAGHESKCRHLHGHNYRIHFVCQAEQGNTPLDQLGRVIDFGVIKELLCMWVENNWDHKFLAWEKDPMLRTIDSILGCNLLDEHAELWEGALVWVPFNPTAENMAQYLVEVVGPQQLFGTGIQLIRVEIEETRKCSAVFEL